MMALLCGVLVVFTLDREAETDRHSKVVSGGTEGGRGMCCTQAYSSQRSAPSPGACKAAQLRLGWGALAGRT